MLPGPASNKGMKEVQIGKDASASQCGGLATMDEVYEHRDELYSKGIVVAPSAWEVATAS